MKATAPASAVSPELKNSIDKHTDALEAIKLEAEKLCEGIQEVKNQLVKRANGAMSHFVGEGDLPKPRH